MGSRHHDSQSETDIIIGYCMVNNSGDTEVRATEHPWIDPQYYFDFLWCANSASSDDSDPRDLSRTVGWLAYCNLALMDDTLYVFSENMGDTLPERWGMPPLGPFTFDDGAEFAALLALEPRTGAIKWRRDYPYGYETIQFVAARHLIFLVSSDQVEAVDIQTHEMCWHWKATFAVRHALVADGLLYVLGAQGKIVTLEVDTGKERWSWQVKAEIVAGYSTIDNGTLYVATAYTLYALSARNKEEG